MVVNLHTHTYRCHHATDTEKQYIERALQGGIKVMGFSEHIPHINADGTQDIHRMWVEDAPGYFETLNALKEEYRGRIELHIGFESEFYPKQFETMFNRAKNLGAEYLLLGQHFLFDGATYVGDATNGDVELDEYVYCIEEAAKTGKFTYLCHPDIVDYCGDRKTYYNAFRKICEISNKYNLPLEINMLGIRDNRRYPNPEFWKIAGELHCETVFGFDAHDAKNAYDAASIEVAEKMVKEFNLNLNEHPKIVQI